LAWRSSTKVAAVTCDAPMTGKSVALEVQALG
jgi:hypothetical protein